MFYSERKKKALSSLKKAEETYKNIGVLANSKATALYSLRKGCAVAIKNVEAYISLLANSPQEYKKEVTQVQLSIQEFNHAVSLEKDYQDTKVKEKSAIAATFSGTAIATLGPTAAMTIATTFGTASTGTAIASLSGAAATNAALAWLGGGAVAAGGGGIAAGQFFLALAGPIGWGLAGILGVGGGFFAIHNNKKVAEKAEYFLCEIKPKIADLERKLQELSNLYIETEKLLPAIDINKVCTGFPKDYHSFTDEQKLKLGSLINSTRAMGILINQRIS